MTKTTPLEVLGLPAEAVKKLEELHITSVEAFSSRVPDMESAGKMQAYICVDDATMDVALRRALEIAPPPEPREHPLGGALIPEKESEDIKEVLAPLHDKLFLMGVAVKLHLDKSVCAQLESPEGIEPLRHELRYSSYVNHVSAVEIRCAIVVADFSAALEVLVFQEEEGEPPKVRLHSSGEVYVGTDLVPKEYFVERIAEALSCNEQLAEELFRGLVKEMFHGRIWFPEFKLSRETCVVLEYNGA